MSLQYCKLARKQNENAEERMGQLGIITKCGQMNKGKWTWVQRKRQKCHKWWWWYNDWDDKGIDSNQRDKWSYQWASISMGLKSEGTKGPKKGIIEATKGRKDCDAMTKQEQKNNTLDREKAHRRETQTSYKYCGNTWTPGVSSLWQELFKMWVTHPLWMGMQRPE